ncbi:MAG: beta-ketoacyl synthase chain length factor [Burkholderiaceae bacterium]|nr:beta-ketoacyl synthase chain length factor [Burkholderiaceae bacterium]
MTIRFSIDRWAAWSPNFTKQTDWLRWFASPSPISQSYDAMPALTEMPAMMRRRVERLGRMALQTAYWGIADSPSCPIVFASRYGDISRSVEMLRQLAEQEPMSPTSFSLSVHNAIGALFSISRDDVNAYTAIAAGEETVEAAFTEALGLLADGENAVLVVYYEEPLPELFKHFSEQPNFPRAWACRLVRSEFEGITLLSRKSSEESPRLSLSPDLEALRFLISDEIAHEHTVGTKTWCWQRTNYV